MTVHEPIGPENAHTQTKTSDLSPESRYPSGALKDDAKHRLSTRFAEDRASTLFLRSTFIAKSQHGAAEIAQV